MSRWNFAEVWETIAGIVPEAPAALHGESTTTWAEFDHRADSLARWLLDQGADHETSFAQLLYSVPEYLEAVYACFKLGLAPVNTNYRYGPDELVYLWDNADASTVLFHGAFAEMLEEVRPRVPGVSRWIWLDDGSGACPAWATPYHEIVASWPGRTVAPWGRSPDDLLLLYTGGTTGMPKGVMWRQDDLFGAVNTTAPIPFPDEGGMDDVRRMITKPGPRIVAAAPLMHGTGLLSALSVLNGGGAVITLPERRFSAASLLDAVQRHRAKSIALVGDAFAKPVLEALDREPDRWDISSLRVVISSGVVWSAPVKAGLLRHNDRLLLVDTLGSSEGLGTARSVIAADQPFPAESARFTLSPHTKVFDEDGREVVPGSGQRGMMAIKGRIPLGYYKDEEKTARTFRTVNGERWSIAGDFATVEADGTITLLGRGSACINTGGEKVFPEEVEAVLLTHPGVVDAVCVGIPDDRFGEQVTAVVVASPQSPPKAEELVEHVKARLAGYKAPRQVLFVPTLNRAANGKADYGALRNRAATELGAATG